MARRNRSNPVLNNLKYEVTKELGYINSGPQDYQNFLNESKFEVANELGIKLNHGYNGDITSRDAGRIGGNTGGKIGGNMVKKMVQFSENQLKNQGHL